MTRSTGYPNNPFSTSTDQMKGFDEVSWSPASGNNIDRSYKTDALPWEKKAAELQARNEELKRKESDYHYQQQQGQAPITPGPTTNSARPKNWPFFYPLLHHSISTDLPTGTAQRLANRSYFIWSLTALAYLMNLVAEVAMMITGLAGYSSVLGVFLAAVYLAVLPFMAFFSWHYLIYQAVRLNSTISYLAYFFTFTIQLAIYAFLAIGFFNGGGGGVFGMLDMFAKGYIVAGVLSAICVAMFVMAGLLGLALIKSVISYFRAGGHSLEEARGEALSATARNQHIRNAAKDAVISSIV